VSRSAGWLLMVVVGVSVLAGCQSGAQDQAAHSSTTTHPSSKTANASPTAHPDHAGGNVATDGHLTFAVTGMNCVRAHNGTGPPPAASCLVDITAQNDGTSSQTFSVADQVAIDTSGNRLPADLSSFTATAGQFPTYQVHPGSFVDAGIPFVLKSFSALVKQVELHEAPSSRGVIIDVGIVVPPTTTTATTSPLTSFTTLPTSLHVGATAAMAPDEDAIDLTLVRVMDQPAVMLSPGSHAVDSSPGLRFFALQFAVVNVGSTRIDYVGQRNRPDFRAILVTSDHVSLSAFSGMYDTLAVVPGCAPFSELGLDPGGRATVCAVFQVPTSATVDYAQVTFVGTTGESNAAWRIP
jgi:hypothetical protein